MSNRSQHSEARERSPAGPYRNFAKDDGWSYDSSYEQSTWRGDAAWAASEARFDKGAQMGWEPPGWKGKTGKGKKGFDVGEVTKELAREVAEHLKASLPGPSAGAASSWSQLGSRSAAIADVDAGGRGVLDITAALTSTLPDDEINIPRDSLLRLQQNLQSAEHCLSRTFQAMVSSAKSMKLELENLQRSIDVLAQHTGHPAQHLQRIV